MPRSDGRGRPRRSALAVAFASVAAVGLAVWVLVIQQLPPRTITLATGPEGSDYASIGTRYREILARSGIAVRVLPTQGDVENLARLRDPGSGVSAAFAMAGLTSAKESPQLESLGTIAFAPLWIFTRDTSRTIPDRGLAGLRISLGPEASGTRALTVRLLALAGIDTEAAELLPLSPAEASERLLRGEIDVAVVAASWDSPAVRRLLAAPEIALVNIRRADAFVALNPYLNKLIVPMGVGDLAANRPPSDVVLLAPKASLLVRKDLNPAIQYLLLDAATQIHSRPGIFNRPGRFPAAEEIDVPLSRDAEHFYKSGPPFLQRLLPVWIGAVVERLLILLIPIAGVLYPLAKVIPGVYRWNVNNRIVRLYGRLKLLEADLETRAPGSPTGDLVARLDELEARADHLRLPRRFAQNRYMLKLHIQLVRDELANARPQRPAEARTPH